MRCVFVMWCLLLVGQGFQVFGDIIDETDDTGGGPGKKAEHHQGGVKSREGKKTPITDDDLIRGKVNGDSPVPASQPVSTDGQGGKERSKKSDAKGRHGQNDESAKEPIKFRSETFHGQKTQGILILEENVVVTQADIRLEADKATLTSDPITDEIKTVVAVGNVKFQRKDPETGQLVRAEGREGILDNQARTVVLKGDPKLWRGKDIFRGKLITYDLKTGWVKADRVEGVVQAAPAASKEKQVEPKPDKSDAIPTGGMVKEKPSESKPDKVDGAALGAASKEKNVESKNEKLEGVTSGTAAKVKSGDSR